jgi:hypothetical protein
MIDRQDAARIEGWRRSMIDPEGRAGADGEAEGGS